jgi:hypothetical protein
LTSPVTWTCDEFPALPSETVTVEIHCVTKWSKLGTEWTGVAVDVLLDGTGTPAEYLSAHSHGEYTTNLPLADVRGGRAWVAYRFNGEPLEPGHGGPARLLVPPVLLEERQMGSGTQRSRTRMSPDFASATDSTTMETHVLSLFDGTLVTVGQRAMIGSKRWKKFGSSNDRDIPYEELKRRPSQR